MSPVGLPTEQPEQPPPPAEKPLWRRAGGWPGLALALVLLAVLRLLQLAFIVRMAHPSAVIRDRLLLWDGSWLIRVAVDGYPAGYTTLADGRITGNALAFFPMFPLLVRLGTLLGLPPDVSSLLVAGIAGGCAGLLIYLLGTSLWSRRVGYVLMVLVCAQPMSVVLGMGYTESLFMALLACVPLARAAVKAPSRTAFPLLALWAAYGLWFGGYMITVWPLAI